MTVLEELAALVVRAGARRVAVDGVDASGKTTLADGLAPLLAASGPVVRFSVDDHLRPPQERYRRGRDSAQGCYRDTHDLAAVRARALAAAEGVLLVDGVFLQRPELADLWDLVVHLQVPDEEVLRRAVVRDEGPPEEVRRRYEARYLPAQRLYEQEVRPAQRADVVLDNTDVHAPVVRRWARMGG